MLKEVFLYAGSSLGIIVAIIEIIKGFLYIKNKINLEKSKISLRVESYGIGLRNYENYKEDDKTHYDVKIPPKIPIFTIRLRLLNTSNETLIVEYLRAYSKMQKEEILFLIKSDIELKPKVPIILSFETKLNIFVIDKIFRGWEKFKECEELENFLWSKLPREFTLELMDMNNKKISREFPLA